MPERVVGKQLCRPREMLRCGAYDTKDIWAHVCIAVQRPTAQSLVNVAVQFKFRGVRTPVWLRLLP